MQQPTHPLPPTGAVAPVANITTEQIQKYLDENKQLILAILDNQNLGKLSECAQYQSLLQKNLLYLAAIADAQPAAAGRPQMMPQGAVPQGGHFMQQQQQQHMFHASPPLQFNPQQMQEQQQQQLHHQTQGMPFPGQMGMRHGAADGMRNLHVPPPLGGSADPRAAQSLGEFVRSGMASSSVDVQGNKQDANAAPAEPVATDGHRSSGSERGGGGDAD